ncbi:MAG TPA: hypothetical protein VJB94_00885 [Candidatus Nanoarchaeia archaeon]|nr:hypothetical protein [Candidatus Nanoarchaeia archaeon]
MAQENRVALLEQYVSEGITSVHELSEKLDVHPRTVRHIGVVAHLNLEDGISNVPKEKAGNYLQRRRSAAYEHRKYLRKNNERIEARIAFLEEAEKKSSDESLSFAERKTWEYVLHRDPNGHPPYSYEVLLKLFMSYENAVRKGEAKSLNDFESETGLWYSQVGKILKRVKLHPLYNLHIKPQHSYMAFLRKKYGLKRI